MANQSISETEEQLRSENEELQLRLAEAEETLYAIRNGEVDAIVVSGVVGPRIFSLTSAETPYRIMVEEMHEGAATLLADTTILHCNNRFAEMVARPSEQIIGASFSQFIGENEKPAFTRLFNSGLEGKCSGEMTWLSPENEVRYFHLSFSPLPPEVTGDVCVIVSDFTERKQAEETLHSHVFLNSVIENSPNALWILDQQGSLNQMNQASRTLFNLKGGEVPGQYNILNDPVFEEQGLMSMIKDVFEKGSIVRFVARYDTAFMKGIETAQGLKLDLDVSISAILDPHGKVTNAIVQFIDITDRKKAEQELKASESKFKNLVWDMPVGVLLQGPHSEMLLSNPKALELLGLNEDQLLGKTSFDPDWNVIREDGSPFPAETHPVPQAIATGLPVRDVVMGVYHPVNNERVWLVDAIPQYNGNGNIHQVVCTFVDVSRRKQVEEELQISEEKYKTIFEQSVVGKSMTSISDGSLKVNKSFCKMLGYSETELSALNWQSITHPDDLERDKKIVISLISGEKETARWEKRYIRKDRKIVWADISTIIQRDKDNNPLFFNTSIIDITQRKMLEQELLEAEWKFRAFFDNSPIAVHTMK